MYALVCVSMSAMWSAEKLQHEKVENKKVLYVSWSDKVQEIESDIWQHSTYDSIYDHMNTPCNREQF